MAQVDRAVRSILGRLVWTSGGGGRGAPGVEEAALAGCGHLTDRSLALLARNCPNLERLQLQKCRDVSSTFAKNNYFSSFFLNPKLGFQHFFLCFPYLPIVTYLPKINTTRFGYHKIRFTVYFYRWMG